jgi:hypothetical protein
MVTPVGKRKAVAHLMEVHQVSQRRACDVLQVDRSSVRYLARRGDDTELRDAIKRVAVISIRVDAHRTFGKKGAVLTLALETVRNFVPDAFCYAIGKRSSNMMAS